MHLYYYTVLCRHGWCSCRTFKKCVSCKTHGITSWPDVFPCFPVFCIGLLHYCIPVFCIGLLHYCITAVYCIYILYIHRCAVVWIQHPTGHGCCYPTLLIQKNHKHPAACQNSLYRIDDRQYYCYFKSALHAQVLISVVNKNDKQRNYADTNICGSEII